jgi:ribosomal protein S18 acetylase RimI-like enzyme
MSNNCIEVYDEIHLNDIVEIHMDAFPGFFLTLLGRSFLTELYRGFIVSDSAVMLVSIDQKGNVLGFAAGTANPQLFFKNLRNTRFIFFLFASMKALLLNPFIVTKKLISAVFYKGDRSNEIMGAALLSSIGVRPRCSGEGVGSSLLNNFENYLSKRNVSSVYLMTDKEGNENVLKFYTLHGYKIESSMKKSDGRLMCRLVKKLQDQIL